MKITIVTGLLAFFMVLMGVLSPVCAQPRSYVTFNNIANDELIKMGSGPIINILGDYATFTGTFYGDETVTNRNNLFSATCRKHEMTCWIVQVDQIHDRAIAINPPMPYEIKKWTKSEILIDDGVDIPPHICVKNTIILKDNPSTVEWIITPVNQHQEKCKKFGDEKVRRWTLGEPLTWKILKEKK